MRHSLSTDRIGLLFWRNVSVVVNYRWTFRPIIDIAIDLFTSKDRYFLWIVAVPLFTISTTFGTTHARSYLAALRRDPLVSPSCDPGRIIVWSSSLDSSMLLLYRKPVTSPILVFTSNPTCFAGATQSQWKVDFSSSNKTTVSAGLNIGL